MTGISTGALTAPFAFLGPAYDEQLKKVYTTLSSRDVLQPRGYLGLLLFSAWRRGPLGILAFLAAAGIIVHAATQRAVEGFK